MMLLALTGIVLGAASASGGTAAPFVEVEEVITTYASADNGAGPMWCYGSPLLVRNAQDVFVSSIETGKGVRPLCNTRWQLWQRASDGWQLRQHEAEFKQREPCPLVGLPDGRLFLSVNPSLHSPNTRSGPCRPLILQFATTRPAEPFQTLQPAWHPDAEFTDHSYRGFAADARTGELLLLNINNNRAGCPYVSYCDRDGVWHPRGRICFPIRACYPQVALADRAAHVLAIGDIVEPVEEWREFKFETTHRNWDYVFRRLFYAHAPDIAKGEFSAPIELETVDATGGHISNWDLYTSNDGTAHLLYLVRPYPSGPFRDKFFPGQELYSLLVHTVLKDGRLLSRETILRVPDASPAPLRPSFGRFHTLPDGKLLAVLFASWTDDAGQPHSGNCLLPIAPKGPPTPIPLDLKHPLTTFFTNTPRGGSEPSRTLDLFGTGDDPLTLRYARVRLP
jgi:hypothetical protein